VEAAASFVAEAVSVEEAANSSTPIRKTISMVTGVDVVVTMVVTEVVVVAEVEEVLVTKLVDTTRNSTPRPGEIVSKL
jgi:hypothetical protein